MIEKPSYQIPSVDQLKRLNSRGPWATKSGGKLGVLFGIDFDEIQEVFFKYREEELRKIPVDVRGLRSYVVSDLPAGTIGANEWHKLRHELVCAVKGSVRWVCEDVYGSTNEFILEEGKEGIWVQPYILHTYQALSDKASLLVIANTLFIPDNPQTHDTYSAQEYIELQQQYRK